jgi:hypothetical protein
MLELLLFPFAVAVIVFIALVVVHEITYKGSWAQKIWGGIKSKMPAPKSGKVVVSDERMTLLRKIHETLEEIEFALLEGRNKRSKSEYVEMLNRYQEKLLKSMEDIWKNRASVESGTKKNLESLISDTKACVTAVTKEK